MESGTVALATFRRPAALERALTAISDQVEEVNAEGRFCFDMLVVDNDPAGTGADVARTRGARYEIERAPGIAAARNRVLSLSSETTLVIFLDDDEVPQEGWLRALVDRYVETGATAVAGRVVTAFPDKVDDWVLASGAFRRPVRVDGQAMSEAATNNLLLHMPAVRALGVRFDDEFGLTGGSDSMFTRALVARGGTIRWAQHAVVHEQEDPERFRRSWVLMRAFRFGNTSARVELALASGPIDRLARRVRMAAKGIARVAHGGARWALGVLCGRLVHRAKGTRMIFRGLGMCAGAVGYAYDEYGRRRRKAG